MASPSPVPPCRRVVELSAWMNGSKIDACLSAAMPMPESLTCAWRITPVSLRCATRTSTRTSPSAVNLIALPTRLISTCLRRPGSPTRPSGTSGSTDEVISRPFSCARGPRDLSASPRPGRRANSICSSTSRRASILEKSSRSLITWRSAPAEDLTRLRYSRCSALSSVPSASSDRPMMAFIGVRISWLMLARNSLLARLAASAASRARRASSSARLRTVTSV